MSRPLTMSINGTRRLLFFLAAGFLCLGQQTSRAGGSGLNVAVVVNQASSNSVALGNYYRERRQVPPENVIRINWTGGNIQWSTTDFTNALLNPLLGALAARGISNQIDYVVLCMDIPYRVTLSGQGENSTTASLFYGFKPDSRDPNTCPLATNSANSYAYSEKIFRLAKPDSAPGYSFLTFLLTGETLAQAKALVDAGVNSDGTFPTNTVLLQKTSDGARNVRFYEFDNAIFNLRLRTNDTAMRITGNTTTRLTNLLGLETGLANFSLAGTSFVPAAMADNLTSYGGAIFEGGFGQTTLLELIKAGAAGSYGTVVEPCNYREKFPDPQNHFLQSRGFTLGESYYQSLINPYQGLLVGEPLAAPFRYAAQADWAGLTPNSILSGTTNLSLTAVAADSEHPVQQVDLFVDGKFFQTLTNIAPAQGNVLNVTIQGHSMNYTNQANETIESVAAELSDVMNNVPNPNFSGASAFRFGDRIEMRALSTITPGSQLTASVSATQGSAGTLTTFLTASRTSFLDSEAHGLRGYAVSGSSSPGSVLSVLVTKTNGATVFLAITNTTSLTLADHVGAVFNLINATPALQGTDGIVAEDFLVYSQVYFNLRARAPGSLAAQVRADFDFFAGPNVAPLQDLTLTEQDSDVQARNHLYVTAGTTNLALTFPLDTTTLADGYHELTAVVYEGTHVHTQSCATIPVVVQNTALSATLTLIGACALTAIRANFTAQVTANVANIASIELFTTGGRFAVVTNQQTAAFNLAGTNLGLGQHPLYALVTTTGGQKFRTPNTVIRLVIVPTLTATTAGGGTVAIVPPTETCLSDSIATVTATPAAGWKFLQWLGDAVGTNTNTSVSMTRDKCVQAVFGTTLGTTVSGNGSVLIDPVAEYYPYGYPVRLIAQPLSGSYFAIWGNAASGNVNPLVFQVTGANPSIAAAFVPLGESQVALTVRAEGMGNVSVDPRANNYAVGANVTLAATADVEQQFIGWSGDASGAVNPLIVTVNQSKNIIAQFTKKPVLKFPDCLDRFLSQDLQLSLNGVLGEVYLVETSTNLVTWFPFLTVTNTFGTTQFGDPGVTNLQKQFYRAGLLP